MFENFKYRFNKKLKRSLNNKDIDKNEMKKMLNKGAILVDVRSPQEYREGHLDNAILIPEYEIQIKHKIKFKSKEEIIILYCSNGTRSKKAREEVRKTRIYKCV